MVYCLSKDELAELLNCEMRNREISDQGLKGHVENSKCWEESLHGLNYLFSHILERYSKGNTNSVEFIELYYSFTESMDFTIEEYDFNFIQYLIKHKTIPNVSLEEELIYRQQKYGQHEYDEALRY